MKILFICTGNTCRSPMAKIMAESIFSQEYTFDSAGLAVFSPSSASGNAIKAVAEKKLDLQNHVSKNISVELLEEADLILTMTKRHKEAIEPLCTAFEQENIWTLAEFVGEEKDIVDPYGGDIEEYRQCLAEIEKYLLILKEKM
ncbi:MAG: low molecular weight protein arginine phosphatase [Anaerotignaceae bacterium]